MFCRICGKEIVDQAVICPHCGSAVKSLNQFASDDAPSPGYAVLGFLIPLVGLILYLAEKDQHPQRAKSAGKGALAGFIVGIISGIIIGIMAGVAATNTNYYYW